MGDTERAAAEKQGRPGPPGRPGAVTRSDLIRGMSAALNASMRPGLTDGALARGGAAWVKARENNPRFVPPLPRDVTDPVRLMQRAGLEPDPWQRAFLSNPDEDVLLLCCRQSGKSTVTAALALSEAMAYPKSLILVFSYVDDQSQELFRKMMNFYEAAGKPMKTVYRSLHRVEFVNGSRIISRPGKEASSRGYSAPRRIIIDEAARVPDELFRAVTPMLATCNGHITAMSTPYGKRGFFHDMWHAEGDSALSMDDWAVDRLWRRVRVTADDCPRYTRKFLDAERIRLGERDYSQEYYLEWLETIGQLFRTVDVEAMFSDDVEMLVA